MWDNFDVLSEGITQNNIEFIILNIDKFNINSEIKDLIFQLYIYYRFFRWINNEKLIIKITKIFELLKFIENYKIEEQNKILQGIQIQILEIKSIILRYKARNPYLFYSFHYYVSFLYEYCRLYYLEEINFTMVYDFQETIESNNTNIFDKFLIIILNNIQTNGYQINIENYSKYLDKMLYWELKNIVWNHLDIKSTSLEIYLDILVNEKIIYFSKSGIEQYYIYYQWKIVTYNTSKIENFSQLYEIWFIDFNSVCAFFSQNIFPIEDKEQAFTLYKKLHEEM